MLSPGTRSVPQHVDPLPPFRLRALTFGEQSHQRERQGGPLSPCSSSPAPACLSRLLSCWSFSKVTRIRSNHSLPKPPQCLPRQAPAAQRRSKGPLSRPAGGPWVLPETPAGSASVTTRPRTVPGEHRPWASFPQAGPPTGRPALLQDPLGGPSAVSSDPQGWPRLSASWTPQCPCGPCGCQQRTL